MHEDKKKILVINTVSFGMGGIPTVIMNYFLNIDRNKIQMDFVGNRRIENFYKEKIIEYGSKVYIFNRNKNPVRYFIFLIRLIKAEQYDVVHVHGNSASMAIDLLASMVGGVYMRIAHCHNTKCKHGMLHRFLLPIFKISYTKALACSNEAGNWIFGKQNFNVLPNGIFTEQYKFSEKIRNMVRKELHLENKLVIGHVGYMNKQKNHVKLFSIFNEIKKRYKNVQLLCITGSDRIPDTIKKMIEEHHLEKDVTVLFKREDISRLMQAMDIFVFPSLYEGLGIVLLEAQASGLPCVVSDQVPREANIIGNLSFFSLQRSDSDWAEKILSTKLSYESERRSCNYNMKQSNYNIKVCCEVLMTLYGL